MAVAELPDLESQRERLRATRLSSPRSWRILHLGGAANGATDIVASLLRALRNLGHTVLHVDTKRTKRDARARGHVDFSSGARGGFGPVYVRLEAIEPILERFAPQMIVCNAGGQCFRPGRGGGDPPPRDPARGRDAERSRRVRLGRPRRATFDYHTTNARNALPMYREAGVRNTMWLPFGIDRDYVLAERPRRARAARRRRSASATPRAAPSATRRCGGSPRATTCASTARAGSCRAPRSCATSARCRPRAPGASTSTSRSPAPAYINVKCGVFETVGGRRGRLHARGSRRWSEFFEYGREIVAFADADDLVERARRAAGRARAGSSRSAAPPSARLVSEHLYEHRWLKLFADIERDLAGEGATSSPASGRRCWPRRSPPPAGPPRRVVISGFYGARNLGDDLLLQSIADGHPRALDGPVQITVAAHNAERVRELRVRRLRAPRSRPRAATRSATARRSCSAAAGCGTTTPSRGPAGCPAGSHGARISVTGLGDAAGDGEGAADASSTSSEWASGRSTDPEAQAVVRYPGRAGRHRSRCATTRSADAARARSPAGALDVRVMPDPVYGLRLPARRLPDAVRRLRAGWRLVAVNLRPWPQAEARRHVRGRRRGAGPAGGGRRRRVRRRADAGGRQVDDAAIRSVLDQLGTAAPTVVLPWDSPVEEILGALEAVRRRWSRCACTPRCSPTGSASRRSASPTTRRSRSTSRSSGSRAAACRCRRARSRSITRPTPALALGGVVEPDVAERVRELTTARREALRPARRAPRLRARPCRCPRTAGTGWRRTAAEARSDRLSRSEAGLRLPAPPSGCRRGGGSAASGRRAGRRGPRASASSRLLGALPRAAVTRTSPRSACSRAAHPRAPRAAPPPGPAPPGACGRRPASRRGPAARSGRAGGRAPRARRRARPSRRVAASPPRRFEHRTPARGVLARASRRTSAVRAPPPSARRRRGRLLRALGLERAQAVP